MKAGVNLYLTGAIGFDWVIVDQGGVSRLISRPRKKLVKQ